MIGLVTNILTGAAEGLNEVIHESLSMCVSVVCKIFLKSVALNAHQFFYSACTVLRRVPKRERKKEKESFFFFYFFFLKKKESLYSFLYICVCVFVCSLTLKELTLHAY